VSDLHPPALAVREAVTRALAEDLLPLGDLTASLLRPDIEGSAFFVARDDGVVAGSACVLETFGQLDPSVNIRWTMDDGAECRPGDVLGRVEGCLASILTAERTALNFLCHLSGVASLTRRYVRAASQASQNRTRIWDTRKTTPGLRALEKAAVRAGGGVNHRGSLSEAVLIKDNHLGGLSIADGVRRAKLRWPGRMIEVECERPEQVDEAVEAGATIVMLDNMAPPMVEICVAKVAGRVPVEVSGRVSLDTVADYAAAGADLISVGALTHSAPVLDIGLDLLVDR
jgi:nicotinate-nucleotide pyrophosphorylase (carboxylating)